MEFTEVKSGGKPKKRKLNKEESEDNKLGPAGSRT